MKNYQSTWSTVFQMTWCSVCKGVSLKLLEVLKSGPIPHKLTSSKIAYLDSLLFKLSNNIPSDFSRKPRSFRHLHLWKATELRLFTLYLMPVILPIFQIYSTSIFIMCSEYLRDELDINYVPQLVKLLIDGKIIPLLGRSFMVYNVHSLNI